MDRLLIRGGNRLEGTLSVQGAKNAVLPILAATLLNAGESVIHNCPRLSDVDASLTILRHLGCRAAWQGDAVVVDSSGLSCHEIPERLMREMRSSVIFLGAVLARTGSARIAYPGGCELGARPIDLHLSALRQMGADIREEGGNILCCVGEGLQGAGINLSFPSVGATENIMLAAALAKGDTIITNAAREPEIEDLQCFLRKMGVSVWGAGTSTVGITGGAALSGCTHAVMSDRIAAATYLSCAVSAGGDVLLENVTPRHFATVTDIFRAAGCEVYASKQSLRLLRRGELHSVRPVVTMPYPGFPTDAQAPVMAALLKAQGTTVFVENIFENRYRHVPELRRMGADIKLEGRVAVVCSVPCLHGAAVCGTDLRGGAALMAAALGACGESSVYGTEHILRGYQAPEECLRGIGADIRLMSGQ